MRSLALVAGVALVIVVISDAVATLVVTQGRSGRWRPGRLWYMWTWRLTRGFAARAPSRAAEAVLDVYPAASLLGLLVLWLVGLLFGWSLVYLGLGQTVNGSGDWGSLLYYAGASLVTPVYGSAHDPVVRILTLVEVLTGLGTIALLISYLPALYGAYSRREARLLTLDDPLGHRITPVRVIAVYSGGGDLDLLCRYFAEWEMWTAEVLESHVSYPMLTLFRSQHAGQSWVTALGVITDAATLTTACVVGAEKREPYLLYRRGRRAVLDIADRLHLRPSERPYTWLTRENYDLARAGLVALDLPLRDPDEGWQRLQELRAPYGELLQQLIDYLLVPHGFWGHSAEETVAVDVVQASVEARLRRMTTSGLGRTVDEDLSTDHDVP
jgi:hypothetical protein